MYWYRFLEIYSRQWAIGQANDWLLDDGKCRRKWVIQIDSSSPNKIHSNGRKNIGVARSDHLALVDRMQSMKNIFVPMRSSNPMRNAVIWSRITRTFCYSRGNRPWTIQHSYSVQGSKNTRERSMWIKQLEMPWFPSSWFWSRVVPTLFEPFVKHWERRPRWLLLK